MGLVSLGMIDRLVCERLRAHAIACLAGGGAIPLAAIENSGPDYVLPPNAAPLLPLYDMLRTALTGVLSRMQPVDNGIIDLVRPEPVGLRYEVPVWVLAEGQERYLVFLPNSFGRQPGGVRAKLPGGNAGYRGRWFDMHSGVFRAADLSAVMTPPSDAPNCLLIERIGW